MKKTLLILATILSFSFVAIPVLSLNNLAFAEDKETSECSGAKCAVLGGVKDAGGDNNKADIKTIVGNIIGTMLFIVGVLSVIMIIYGGIMYVISAGDSGKIGKAKNTIIYAVVGLVVSILSYSIVNFVISQL